MRLHRPHENRTQLTVTLHTPFGRSYWQQFVNIALLPLATGSVVVRREMVMFQQLNCQCQQDQRRRTRVHAAFDRWLVFIRHFCVPGVLMVTPHSLL